jgi:hypothetical protein
MMKNKSKPTSKSCITQHTLKKRPIFVKPSYYTDSIRKKDYGQLVLLGFDVTAFTPAAYQGRSLQPPL